MSIVESTKAKNTLRFWQASLAWKNIGGWAKGWTVGSFIQECRYLCRDQGSMGEQADRLLEDVINDRERVPLPEAGTVVQLTRVEPTAMTQFIGQAI